MKWKNLAIAAFFAMFLALPVWAHHSHGNYDLSKWETLEGTVKQIVLINPHSIVYLDVKDAKGDVKTWSVEATNPRGIYAKGAKAGDVKAGDPIKVRCHLLRDGSPGCLLGFVTPQHGDVARGHGVEHEWD
jgi:hypothetical protein